MPSDYRRTTRSSFAVNPSHAHSSLDRLLWHDKPITEQPPCPLPYAHTPSPPRAALHMASPPVVRFELQMFNNAGE